MQIVCIHVCMNFPVECIFIQSVYQIVLYVGGLLHSSSAWKPKNSQKQDLLIVDCFGDNPKLFYLISQTVMMKSILCLIR